MKRIILALLIALIPAILLAHPPKKVTVTYNKDENKLTIVAEHHVKDVKDHYIKEITITVDGKEVKVLTFKDQSSATDQTTDVVIPDLKAGSKIEVKATCNKFGSKTSSIVL
jgi:hypothetical protein